MDKFKDREQAFEKEHSIKEQNNFDDRNLRNKQFAEFVLEHIGSNDQNLLKEIILSDLEEPGDQDIINKAYEIIQANNGSLTKSDLEKKINEL